MSLFITNQSILCHLKVAFSLQILRIIQKKEKKIQFLECNLIPAMISLQNNVTETISAATIEHHKERLLPYGKS
jgi:hypothetical protein